MTINQNQRSQSRNTSDNAPENKVNKYTKIFFPFHGTNFMINIYILQVIELKKPVAPVLSIIQLCHWWRLYRRLTRKIFHRLQ